MSMYYHSSVAPPPGLDGFDEMTPLKVELPFSPNPYHATQTPVFIKDCMGSCYAGQFSLGEWASKVNSVSPYLNTQGLHRALAILDQATRNVQQAKALEEAMETAHEAGPGGLPFFHCATTFSMLQAQLQEQQQRLLEDLQRLPLDPASVRNSLQPSLEPCLVLPAAPTSPESSSQGLQLPAMHPTMLDFSPPGEFLPTGSMPKGSMMDSPKVLSPSASRKVQTLSTSLQLLSGEDPDCLFIVRRINKLGFKAVRTLKRHFSAQGPVMKVLLAHSTVRQHGDPACHARRRPSSLGFVQMGTAEAANKVLALGCDQEVDGVMIRVQRFERQRDGEGFDEEDPQYQSEEPSLPNKCIYERGVSEAEESISTASPLTSPSLTHSLSLQAVDIDSEPDLEF